MAAYSGQLYFASFAALLGSLAYGYQLGVLNTPLAHVASDLGFRVETHGAAVVSALLLGGIFGALAAGVAADALGPKRAMMLNNLLLAAGCAASFWSLGGFIGLFAARVVTGLAGGAISLFVPRYVAETAPPAIRGALGSLSQLFICSGILLSYLAGAPYIHSSHPHWAGASWWQWMLLFPAAPALVQSALLLCCPESPIWLRWRGRLAEARSVERRLSMPETDGSDAATQPLLSPDSEAQQLTGAQGTSWPELLQPKGRYAAMMLLAIGVPLTQQISGINTVIYYSSDIFAKAGLRSPVLGAVLVGIVNILGTLLSTAVTDAYGRKPLMVLSHAGMAVSLLGITLSSWLPGVPAATVAQAAFALVLVFVVFFSFGSGPLPFLYASEILSSDIKGKVSSVAISLNWVANLAVGLTFPAMLRVLGIGGAYLIYGFLNVACSLFCAAFMVETKQKPMHQIHSQLLRDVDEVSSWRS